jgi:hypothetical protein
MLANIVMPTREQEMLFIAIDEALKERIGMSISENKRRLIVAKFVYGYDFTNTAIVHKSAGSWARMIIEKLGIEDFGCVSL